MKNIFVISALLLTAEAVEYRWKSKLVKQKDWFNDGEAGIDENSDTANSIVVANMANKPWLVNPN